jgi:hypothetical protein
MQNHSFYTAILGLSPNWNIYNISEDKQSGLLVLHIKCSSRDCTYACCSCGSENSPAGVKNRRWLYNNKLNIRFYVSLDSPHILCKKCGSSHTIAPWKSDLSIKPEPVDQSC